jgi:parvulin-like peptidyl-prolyl isomerase
MKRITFFTLFTVFLVSWGFAQANLQPAAIVNMTRSEPITVGQFRAEVEGLERVSGRTLSVQEQREVLDAMINERLAMQAAERDRITVTDNEVNAQVNQLRVQMVQAIGRQPTDAEFATAIRNQTGLDLPAFRDKMRRQLIVQKYLMSKKQSTIESAIRPPTEADITNYFNLRRSELVRPDTVRFSMIQVPYGPDAASKTRAKETADRLAREIGTSPSRFDEVVLRGQAPNSGYQAGDVGYLPRNMEAAQQVGQEFLNIAFSLKQGEVSRLIEGQMGYQIIKITETYSMKSLELDDIVQPGSRVTVREFIQNGLMQEQQARAIERASQELIAELRTGRPFQIFERNLSW